MPTPVAQHDVRGRGASGVGIPTAGWKDILWRTYNEVVSDHVLLIAAGVTFYGLLALVPALTALVSLYGMFADPTTLDRHMELLEGLIPSGELDIVREQLGRLAEQGQTPRLRAGFAGGVRHRPVERELRCEVHVRGDECRLRRGGKAQLRPVDRRDHGLHPGDVCRNLAPDWAYRGAADRPAVHRSRDRRWNGRRALAGSSLWSC